MKVQIYGKNITVTPAIAEKIEKKLNHLEKYFIIDENVVANVVVRVYPNKQKIEVTIPTKFAVLRAEVVQDDLYAAIDLAIMNWFVQNHWFRIPWSWMRQSCV